MDRSKRLDVPNGSHRDIQMGRRQRKIGQQGDAKPCGDERARDRDVADFMGDVGLEAGLGTELFEQYAVGMEPSARRGDEALSGQLGQPERAARGERMGERERDAVWIVCEIHLVEALVGSRAPILPPLPHAEHDCQIEISSAHTTQLLRLFDVFEPDLDVGVRCFETRDRPLSERQSKLDSSRLT